jgi:hypothetical protein
MMGMGRVLAAATAVKDQVGCECVPELAEVVALLVEDTRAEQGAGRIRCRTRLEN